MDCWLDRAFVYTEPRFLGHSSRRSANDLCFETDLLRLTWLLDTKGLIEHGNCASSAIILRLDLRGLLDLAYLMGSIHNLPSKPTSTSIIAQTSVQLVKSVCHHDYRL